VGAAAMFFLKAYDGRNAWWRWLLTILLTLMIWLLGHIPLLWLIEAVSQKLGLSAEAFLSGEFPAGVDRNPFLLLSLLPFVVVFLALWLLVRWLHRRPFLSVITGRPRFDWRRAFVAFAIGLIVSAVGTFAVLPTDTYSWQFMPSTFWPLLAIALVMIPIQTATEEIFFRGYLMQGLSLLLKNKLGPLIIITLLFAFAHTGNPEFAAGYGTVLVVYLLLSVLFGLCTVMDDGLEVSCGLHAANNIFLALVLSPSDGSLATYSLFTTRLASVLKYSPWLDLGQMAVIFGILFYIYRWRFSALTEPIKPLAESRSAEAQPAMQGDASG
jgi:CAAX protease family protein